MKIDRQVSSPRLYEYAQRMLPKSLVVKEIAEGYGRGYYVYERSNVPMLGGFFGRGDPIAELFSDSIYLFHHNYYSDMEALGMAYEKATGYEITLRYSQEPKASPLNCAR